jgi:hypothetical protein
MSFDKPSVREFIRDFSPGFLDVPEEDTLPPGATPDARNGWYVNRNVDAKDRAKLAKRPGVRLVNPTATVAAAKVDGLFEFRSSGGRELVKVIDGKVYVFDGVNTFSQVGATSPFTAGRTARAEFFRDNAFISDGTAHRRYDGTSLYTVGQVAPTSVTNMGAVAPSGAGLTGTFEAFYVWYDPTMDHESSPSAITSPTALVAQARRHTQPGGAPAAQYTQWRAYVRRTDTNETKFMRVGTWALASGTHDEETLDAARVNPGPNSGDNDPPPGAWKILKEWKGYFLGVLDDSSDYCVSGIGGALSWNPRDRFSVRKGDGEYLTGVKAFGEDILLQKPHRTWRLVGDRPPFILKPMHSSYGGVSQESGLEVDGRFYDWDRERGPYVTDGLQWKALADATIRDTIDTVNRDGLTDIRCIHVEGEGLVGWAVPIGATTRKRMILWYDYLLNCWLPPWTGLEYASFATFTDSSGVTGSYVGDYWGRVFELFSGDRDGVDAAVDTADLTADVTAGTTSTVTAAAASFPTSGSGLAGLPVAVRDPGGNWQWRRILSNTATVITLDTTNDAPFTTAPAAGWTVVVAGIEWYHWTPWFDQQVPHLKKQLHFLYLQGRMTSEAHQIAVHARFNDDAAAESAVDIALAPGSASGVWGSAIWGTSLWGTTSRKMRKHRIDRSAFSVQFSLSNYYPDQPATVTAFGFSGDVTEFQVPSV